MRLPIEPKLPDLPVRSVAEMGLKELERVRLILRGGSVVDWRRLHFRNRDEVDRFLRLCGLDLTHPQDEAWARLVLSDADLSRMVTAKVNGVLAEAREKGLPILDYSPSTKSRESLITKLLAKRENVAAQVYDKTRFRIVTPTCADILPVLYFLTQRLFPFK